ncbi:MAG: lamin tail domain-containing protein [Akkermansiaceae bacterium]
MKKALLTSLLAIQLLSARDSAIVFNEIHYHPAGDDSSLEFVELYNQLAVDTDISNWRIDGDIQFNFPEGTTIPARSYLVVAKDPSALQAATGHSGALGPYEGFLSNSGNNLSLYNNNLSFVVSNTPPPTFDAETLWNVDLQGNGNGGAFGQLAPPSNKTGSANGLGGTWNYFNVGGHSTTSTNPSLSLVESDGSASPVDFTITGTVSGWSQNGDALHADYLFVNAGNADSQVDWQITGLDSGESYTLVLYGGVARDIAITVDTDGDGNLSDESPVIAPANASVVVEDITPFPGASALILGRASQGTVGEGNWGGFQLFIPATGGGGGGGGAPTGGLPSDSLDKRRVMDEVVYSDTSPWPVAPDGSGHTLAKIDPMTGSIEASNWNYSNSLNGSPGSPNFTGSPNSIVFNEVAGTLDGTFRVELHNPTSSGITYTNFVISSSDPLHADFPLPAGSLAAGAYITFDGPTLGFSPQDNNRLFLFNAGKSSLLDSVRVDDRAQARFPDGANDWFRPDSPTFGSGNLVTFEDGLVINEILYHAYPDRGEQGSPPPTTTTAVLNYDAVWRYNLNAGAAGLPSNWATSSHTVDNISWAEGPGLLGEESSTLGEPIRTKVPLSSKITYYFETDFNYSGTEPVSKLIINHYIDDGAVFYLNGIEIDRVGMPGGIVTPTTPASPGVGNATLGTLTINDPNILIGSNRLSVEIHQSNTNSSDVVMGVEATLEYPLGDGGDPESPYTERKEEWIELYNKSLNPISLDGWQLDGGIRFDFPAVTIASGDYLVVAKDSAELAIKHPSATIVGDYSGKLANRGEEILLVDAKGNPADKVRYYDSRRWHPKADGNGSSLELRNPEADNNVAGAWAPSLESGGWQTITYTGTAINDGIGNNVYHEFLIALLDAGEFLLDDVSVVENGSIEFIQNGDFESDTIGSTADKWRAVGTHGSHGKTVVVADPDDPNNQCLHVVATGPTEDKHNKLETTFANSERVVAGREYTITFRAKWLSGSNQVNSRLYFNYLQQTNLLEVPESWGTPGSPNSTTVANTGPDLSGLSHSPVIPNSGQPVTVSITASDTSGINDLTLFYSVNGGSFNSVAMSAGANGSYNGIIPGQSSNRIIRFYVRGRDASLAESFFPADGNEGGAFYKVQDGYADNSGLRHNFRIIMSNSDRSFLFLNTNRMSNDRFPVTVIEDEEKVYYDVGLRLKASGFGRYQSGHYGFNVEFQPDQLFRGVHRTISIERSPNLKELLAKMLMNRAGGGYWSFYDDVAHIITPTSGDRGPGLLSMSRHTETFFDALFPDSDDSGTLFNQELLYNPNGTTGGPEGLKIGNPYNHTNGRYDLVDRGADKEPYRWGFQIRSARGRDDYSQLVELNQAMSLSGTALKNALDDLIDVDQWMRTFAMMSLNGTDDIYSRIWEHNFRYYVRPTDNKIIVLQWDLDRSFQLGTSSSVTPDRNTVVKLFSIPQYRRLFDGHLHDLAATTFNSTYTTPLAAHLTTLTGDNLNGLPNYITSRASHASGTLPGEIPFTITTNGGSDFSIDDSAVDLEGDGWINIFSITVNGQTYQPDWTDADSWRLTIPLAIGANLLELKAYSTQGLEVGTDSITVTNTSTVDLASAGNTTISEVHYHPAEPNAAEIAAGFTDQDDFEFIEILNTSSSTVIDLTGSAFTDGIAFTFAQGTTLAQDSRLIIVSNRPAFEFRYGAGTVNIAGEYSGQLNNGGERVRLAAANGNTITDFTYGDSSPWPESADGDGYSLVFNGIDPASPFDWRTSVSPDGTPGSHDGTPFSGSGDEILTYALSSPPAPSLSGDLFQMSYLENLNADDAVVVAEYSTNLSDWTTFTATDFISRVNQGDGTALVTYSSPLPVTTTPFQFLRLRVMER